MTSGVLHYWSEGPGMAPDGLLEDVHRILLADHDLTAERTCVEILPAKISDVDPLAYRGEIHWKLKDTE